MSNTTFISNVMSQMALEEKQHVEQYVVGWNGALEFATTGNNFGSQLLNFDFKFVVPKECFKHKKLDSNTIETFDKLLKPIINGLKSQSGDVYKQNLETLFRYLFYSRAFRESGKGSRLGFYYLFERLYQEFPEISNSMLQLLPEYGYFGDLNHLMDIIPEVTNTVTDIYVNI